MNILITGSTGFVGKKLVKQLKKQGHTVKEFDTSLGQDITNKKQCEQACQKTDAVYHLAAILDEQNKLLEEVNVKGTENILEAAAKARCKQFIFLSTVGIHGNYDGTIDEKTPIMPATKYEKSKAKAEKLVHEFQEMVPATIIRAALVLGPNKYWEKIIKMVKKGFPIIQGGKQVWQTIYIDDLADALVFVLGKEECINETFVIAEQEKHTLLELYKTIQETFGMKAEIKTMPLYKAMALATILKILGKKSIISKEHIQRLVRQREYNTSKIESLGWRPKTTMKEAVKKTLAAPVEKTF